MLHLLLALALAPAPTNWIELDRPSFAALRGRPEETVVPAWAAERAVSVTPVADGVLVRARWTLRSLTARAWFSGQVLGDMPGLRLEAVLWDGKAAATAVGPGGVTVTGQVSGRAVIEVVAFVPGDPVRAALRLVLLPASRGELEVGAPVGLVPTLQVEGQAPIERRSPRIVAAPGRRGTKVVAAPVGPEGAEGGHRFLTGAPVIDLSFGAAASAPGDAAPVVVARAGLGLTLGDAELRGRGRLVWELRRGAVSAVQFAVVGIPADAAVTGPGVRAVQRSGEVVRVELQAPVSTRLELELRWSTAIGKATESRVVLPQIRFDEVFRAEASLQLARDGEVEGVPVLTGWTPSSAAGLPVWGQGLVEGTPTAAFKGGGSASGGELELLRFVPIEGPPVVVDVAAYTIATSREGRALMRAHYEVRNERAASLKVTPPRGFKVLGVRVAGQTAVIARDSDGAWRVPLQRSVDTVSGLLSFPVEVALLGDGAAPWARREKRELPLPRLDAPVAVTRVTLHLPPGYRSRKHAGDGEVVAAFTRGEGIHYGMGVGEVGAAEADALFQNAVKGWLGNDFDQAQADLDRLRAMGAKNENIARLQGNLDLIAGKADRDGKDGANRQDESVNRRIREQARARAAADQVAQRELQAQADDSRKSGNYEVAERQYRQAIEVGDRLAKLEQRESVEQSSVNAALLSELESTKKEAEAVAQVQQVQVSGKQRRGAAFRRKSVVSKSTGDSGGLDANAATDDRETDEDVAYKRARPDGAGARETPVAEPEEIGDLEPMRPAPDPAPVDVPVGGNSRDFTAVIDVTPTATGDAAGVRLAGTSGAESRYVIEGADVKTPDFVGVKATIVQEFVEERTEVVPISATGSVDALASAPGVSRPAFGVVRGGLIERARRTASERRSRRQERGPKPTADAGKPADAPALDSAEPPAGMPMPVVTASALSVVVPAVGEAVLYQRLLLPADASHVVEISAREPLISRD